MADPPFDEVARKFKQEEATKMAKINAEFKTVLGKLTRDSVTKIIVEWDGHGDDGGITSMVFVKSDGTRTEQNVGRSAHGPDQVITPIEDLVFTLIPQGWETNEGGFGTCVIDVRTGEYDLNHLFGAGKPYNPGR